MGLRAALTREGWNRVVRVRRSRRGLRDDSEEGGRTRWLHITFTSRAFSRRFYLKRLIRT